MRWDSVLAWRVGRQHLARRATDPLAVISDICGLHAQVMSSAQLTLHARVEDPPDVATLDALVKTWAMRGTLHLLRKDELGLYVGAQGGLKPRYEQKSWLKHFELTPEDVQTILTGVPTALRDGPLDRAQLAERVHPGLGRGYGDLLKPLAFRGEIVVLADKRFALPEPFEKHDPEDATKELARRFLTRYGPATREEFAKWFGAPSPAAPGRWIKALDVAETEFGYLLARGRRGVRERAAGWRGPAAAGVRPVRRRRPPRRAGDDEPGADLPPRRLVLPGPAGRRRDGRRLVARGRRDHDRAVRRRRPGHPRSRRS